MKINIKGATPENIASTIKEIMEQFKVDMWSANIYINFTKEGVPQIFVNDKYEELYIERELNPTDYEIPPLNLGSCNFVSKAEQKNYIQEQKVKEQLEWEEFQKLMKIGYLIVGEINNAYKIFPTKNIPDETYLKKKEKDGYIIQLIIKHNDYKNFLDSLKIKFKEEHKEIKKGSYPLFSLNLTDIKHIESQANEVIFRKGDSYES